MFYQITSYGKHSKHCPVLFPNGHNYCFHGCIMLYQVDRSHLINSLLLPLFWQRILQKKCSESIFFLMWLWILAPWESAMNAVDFGSQIMEMVSWPSFQELNNWDWVLHTPNLRCPRFRPLSMRKLKTKLNPLCIRLETCILSLSTLMCLKGATI